MNASVFLSAANVDYSAARAVYKFLTDRGLTCFFCDESLLRVGEDKYRSTVDRALANAERVVVVAGDGARAESEWVKYAWQRFAGGTVTGGVRGSVVTVMSGGMERADLPATLRRGHCVSFPAQLETLPRLLEGQNVAPDKSPRPAPRFLALITACNVVILGLMVWLLQRHGFTAWFESSPPDAGVAPCGPRGLLREPDLLPVETSQRRSRRRRPGSPRAKTLLSSPAAKIPGPLPGSHACST